MLSASKGVTLIELMIAVAIIAIIAVFAMPSYQGWITNTRARASAEGMLNGLQLARGEAVRRNANVEFITTTGTPDVANVGSVAPSPTGTNWMVRVFRAAGPYTAADFVQGQSGAANSSVTGSPGTITFNALGRTTLGAAADILVGNGSGTCEHLGGTVRCLRLQVPVTGQVRMCDPKVVASDPRACV